MEAWSVGDPESPGDRDAGPGLQGGVAAGPGPQSGDEGIVTVVTGKGSYRAKKLILTPGAWIAQLVPALKVRRGEPQNPKAQKTLHSISGQRSARSTCPERSNSKSS